MTISIAAIDGTFALEVRNVRLWEKLDDVSIRALDDALSRHGVLVFRRQSLDEAELVGFSTRFGTADKIVREDWASSQNQEVTRISNLRDAASTPIGGLGSGELAWHTDQSYMPNPATGAVLQGIEVPEGGPRTSWANLALAYEALPLEVKKAVASRKGIFSYAKRVSGYDQESTPEDVRRKTPDVLHALVNTHPQTGQKALYLDPATTAGIEGMPTDEATDLLDELETHATSSNFIYTHHWQSGDVVMWDNGFLLHKREAFSVGQNRLLKRTTIRLSSERHILPSEGRQLITPIA